MKLIYNPFYHTCVLLFVLSIARSQTLDVAFRYLESPDDNFIRVFVPGTMPEGTANDWGPNSSGFISPDAPSQMVLNETIDAYEKTYSLTVGVQYLYKIHFHHNSSGTNYSWISDPLNPETTDDNYNNSILDVTDPLFFQPARHLTNSGMVDGISVGVFTNGVLDSLVYAVGSDTINGMDSMTSESVFYAHLDPPRSIYESCWIRATINGVDYIVYDQPAIEVEEAVLPPGVEMGPNWIDGQMFLAVHAPAQPVVQVLVVEPGESGSDAEALVMKKATGLEDIWWIELDMSAGEYEYEYLLLNGTRLPDPLSRRVINGKTRIVIGSGGVSTADDYQWQSNEYIRPALDTLIIYELHVDDFAAQGSGQGHFNDVIARLDHLQRAGINAIELMPVTEFPGGRSWGYNNQILSAVESSYGTPAEFKELIDTAHEKGIAIIMDMVWNHMVSSSPLWQIQPDMNLNPYFKNSSDLNPNEVEGTWGMLDVDHFNPYTVDYIHRVHRIWVDEYRVDGFRFDATRFIGWDMNQQELGLLGWTSLLHDYDPSLYITIEHLAADPWLVMNSDITAGWHDSFHDRLLDHVHGNYSSAMTFMSQVVGLHEYSNWDDPYDYPTQVIKYMVSHDEQSLIQEMVQWAGLTIDQAREKDKFYATILFTSRGTPMIWQGQELGFQSGWMDDNGNGNWDEEKLSYRPLDWGLLDSESGQDHLEYYTKLMRLRKKNPALYRGTFYDLWRYSSDRVIVYGYHDQTAGAEDDQVVVIANFHSQEKTVTNVPFLAPGNWVNLLDPGNDLFLIDSTCEQYTVPPFSAHVYANRAWNLTAAEQQTHQPELFQLYPVYPNPFNSSVILSFDIPPVVTRLITSVQVYDINGRLVETLLDEPLKPGSYKYTWSPVEIPSGVYFLKLSTDTQGFTRKITYVK